MGVQALTEQALVEQHLKFAYRIASRYFLPGSEVEDVRQEAAIALMEAARSFRPGTGGFRPFAAKVIRRRLFDCMVAEQREKRRANHGALQDELLAEDGNDWLIESLPGWNLDPCDIAERHEEVVTVLRGITLLSPLEQRSVLGLANGLTYDQISESGEGEKRKAIDNATQRARHKLRAAA